MMVAIATATLFLAAALKINFTVIMDIVEVVCMAMDKIITLIQAIYTVTTATVNTLIMYSL